MLVDFDARSIALDPTRSFIVQAPAGSGKTGLLVYRMLSLLATVQQPRQVLAITFTRKATAEMRQRLMQLLSAAERGEVSNDSYEQQGIELAHAVIQRNHELDWQLLESPHQLQIQTIDAFCGRLAGSMPWLSRLGDRPRTTDKADAHYAAAVEQLLLELLESDSDLSEALQSVMLQLDYNYNKARKLFTSMLRQRDQWLRHVVHNDLPKLRGALQHAWQTVANEQVAILSRLMPAQTTERLLTLAGFAHRNLSKDEQQAAVKISDSLAPLAKFERSVRLMGVQQWQALAQMLLTADGAAFRKQVNVRNGFPPKTPEKQEFEALLAELAIDNELLGELNGALRLPQLQFNELDWAQLTALDHVLKVLAGLLQLRFRAAGECDHSEVTQRANLALQELSNPTELALHLDYELQHILVDEFQDTSHAQIELLKRLTRGWTPGQGPARSLFLVGDPMQSIYRFREADVSLFLQVADNASTQVFDNIDIEPLVLSENFRSSSTLVKWFNQTFATSFPAHNNVLSGAIRYATASSNKPKAVPAVNGRLATDKAQEAALVVEALHQALRSLPDENSQVAILVRSRNHLLHLLPAIRAAGIGYTGVDIQPLANQQVVIDILALCKAICREDDRVSWLGLLRGPWCGSTLNEIKKIAPRLDASVWQQLIEADSAALADAGNAQRLSRFIEVMQQALAQRQQVSLSALCRWTWQQLGGPATLFGASLEDVETVFELIAGLERGGDLASMNELDTALEGLYAQPQSERGDKPRVVISTMHKAKGLQYDTVVLPCLSRKARGQDKEILMWAEYQNAQGQSQLLLAPFQLQEKSNSHYNYLRELDKKRAANEAMRLMYVACTRAERQLILIGEATVNNEDDSLKPPVKSSLLATIWEASENQFTVHHADAGQSPPTIPPQLLQRIPQNFQPDLASAVEWRSEQQLATQLSDEDQAALEYQWSSELASVVGTVLHRWLQYNQSRLLAIQPDDELMAAWRAELLNAGLPPERLSVALPRMRQALQNMQSDSHASFIFADHAEQHNEYCLAANEDGLVNTYRIDRTFVADGVRWVIDYKTTYTEAGDINAFIDQQIAERHRPQLEKYGALMQH
ncbi:MAG: UvrD-helicase domain-containing protein, partial [Pseudomonadales bacterium]|nr:UvrD-helicase domain-containing protein [Pseudomonadales bacterium]